MLFSADIYDFTYFSILERKHRGSFFRNSISPDVLAVTSPFEIFLNSISECKTDIMPSISNALYEDINLSIRPFLFLSFIVKRPDLNFRINIGYIEITSRISDLSKLVFTCQHSNHSQQQLIYRYHIFWCQVKPIQNKLCLQIRSQILFK